MRTLKHDVQATRRKPQTLDQVILRAGTEVLVEKIFEGPDASGSGSMRWAIVSVGSEKYQVPASALL